QARRHAVHAVIAMIGKPLNHQRTRRNKKLEAEGKGQYRRAIGNILKGIAFAGEGDCAPHPLRFRGEPLKLHKTWLSAGPSRKSRSTGLRDTVQSTPFVLR